MEPLFKIAIVDAHDGHQIHFPGGGPLERDLIQVCTEAIVKRGVGFFKTEAKVRDAIREGITEAIRELKWDTVHLVR